MADRSAGASAQARADAQRAKAQRLLDSANRWERGADGEAAVAEKLRQLPPLFTVLHDLQVPGSRANIDHLVVGPSGVFVVDAKHYRQPLRLVDGMLWRGRYSIRKELETVSWEAAQAGAVLGVPVHSVICFVGSTLPDRVIDIGTVRVTTDEHLLPAITSGTAGFDINDISRITLLANRHLPAAGTASNRPSKPLARTTAPTSARLSRRPPTSRTSRPRPASRRRTKQSGSLLGGLAMLVAAAVLMMNAGTISRTLSGLVEPTTPTTSVTPAPLLLNGDFSCTTPGGGWTLTFLWPGDGAVGGYEFSTSADQSTWTPLASWQSSAQAAPRVSAIGSSTAVHVQLSATRSAGSNTVGTFRSPDAPC